MMVFLLLYCLNKTFYFTCLTTSGGCAAVGAHIAGAVAEGDVATVAAYRRISAGTHHLLYVCGILCAYTYCYWGQGVLWFLHGLRLR